MHPRLACVSRRALLGAGLGGLAGLGAAACARLVPGPRPPGCAPASRTVLAVPLADQAQLAAFAASAPGVDPIASATVQEALREGVDIVWLAEPAQPGWPGNWWVPLDEAMHRMNLDLGAAGLLPGLTALFQDDGSSFALPAYVQPLGLQYMPAAFAAAGIAPPGPGWTLADLQAAVAPIQRAVDAGLVVGCSGALPRMLDPSGFDLLSSEAVLLGFILGHGGEVVTATEAYDLTGDGAVLGLAAALGLAKVQAQSRPSAGAHPAMNLVPYTGFATSVALAEYQAAAAGIEIVRGPSRSSASPPAPPTPVLRWARTPLWPVRPVVPATAAGWGLGDARNADFPGMPRPATVPAAAVDALVAFCRWWYAADPGPEPPVVGGKPQAAYWSAAGQANPGASAVGDWPQYAYVGAGWPWLYPGGMSVGTAIHDALLAAAAAGGGAAALRAQLAQASSSLNASVARMAADMANASSDAARAGGAATPFVGAAGVDSVTAAAAARGSRRPVACGSRAAAGR